MLTINTAKHLKSDMIRMNVFRNRGNGKVIDMSGVELNWNSEINEYETREEALKYRDFKAYDAELKQYLEE
jgi:hypothetical protein